MKTLAVTGGIAGGKSTVTRMLADLGAATHSADEDARAVLAPGSPTLAAVLEAFPEAHGADGTLDRAALGARIFGDGDARARLNALMHPAIRARMRAVLDAAKASDGPGVVAYEVPLLYEGGLETWFDAAIAVVASAEAQAARLQAREAAAGRPPLPDAAIAERLTAQMPPEAKAARADFVVRTDVALEETRAQVRRVWDTLRAGGRPGPMTPERKEREYEGADWLRRAAWRREAWRPPHPGWRHDHCVFCHATISDDPGYEAALRACWRWENPDPDGNDESVCDYCFHALRDTMGWTMLPPDDTATGGA